MIQKSILFLASTHKIYSNIIRRLSKSFKKLIICKYKIFVKMIDNNTQWIKQRKRRKYILKKSIVSCYIQIRNFIVNEDDCKLEEFYYNHIRSLYSDNK